MLQAMFSGVSGLQTHQTELDVIGNNIANVNTVGFKSGRVTFQDQLSQTLRASSSPNASTGGQNPSQVGLGVALGAVDTLQTQGNLQSTGKTTDLAIQGNGFFMVSGNNNTSYTRDGSFDMDSDGVLVNPANGLKLLGYVADSTGKIDMTQPITPASILKVPVGSLTSVQQSASSSFAGNLDATSSLVSTKVAVSGELDTGSAASPMNSTVYDSAGNAHTMQVALSNPVHNPAAGAGVPAGATQRWDVVITMDNVLLPASKMYGVPDGSGGNKFVFADNANPANSMGSTLTLNATGGTGASNFPLVVDFSGLQAKSNVVGAADGQGGTTPIQSSLIALTGNVNMDGGVPAISSSVVYKADGTAYNVTTSLSNPVAAPAAGPNVPVGATQQWDIKVSSDTVPPSGATTLFDSSVAANGESKVYFVPGTGFVTADNSNPAVSLGSTISMVAASLPPATMSQGKLVSPGFPIQIDLSKLNTTKVASVADGQSGTSATWNSSMKVFDSLGVSHLLNVNFVRALPGSGAPTGAAGRWEWSATENGTQVGSSAATGNSALFFDSSGKLLNTQQQSLTITPNSGGSPFTVSLDYSSLTQLAGKSSVAATPDGYAVGTLQSFTISEEGLINGTFSNGQARTLGQIATASFSNPAGLLNLGQNLFGGSSNSGTAQVGLPDMGGRGKISTGFVEMSNVDLSTEFTNLIVTQRGFQANTKIITAVDQLLQDVISLVR